MAHVHPRNAGNDNEFVVSLEGGREGKGEGRGGEWRGRGGEGRGGEGRGGEGRGGEGGRQGGREGREGGRDDCYTLLFRGHHIYRPTMKNYIYITMTSRITQ